MSEPERTTDARGAIGPIEAPVRRYTGRDGARLAYREIGSGPPVLLLHGFLATGRQWLDQGHAGTLAARGYRIIVPDLRGHCDSTDSHDPHDYPPDVLTDDGLALIEHLDVLDYALGGYSLGARVALRMLTRTARPAKAIIAGQGLAAVTHASTDGTVRRALTSLANGHPIPPGSPEAAAAHWIAHLGGDPRALLHVLDTLIPTPVGALREIRTPTLVAVGEADHQHACADRLAKTLANARFTTVPGDHWTALAQPTLTKVLADFLADPPR